MSDMADIVMATIVTPVFICGTLNHINIIMIMIIIRRRMMMIIIIMIIMI